MSATVFEWLNLLVRWIHVLAAIMWVGDSFLFMWLDSHLTAPSRPREGAVVGELWMVHSGGFYEVVKRKSLGPDELPPNLYWFKWESYTTWISGFLLLIVVYYVDANVFLVDPASGLSANQSVLLSLGLLVSGFLGYDIVWRVLGARHAEVARWISWILLVDAVVFLTWIYPGRAAFLHTGAMLGTLMAANVFFRIIPAQRHMLAQTRAGLPVDVSYGARAKQRSIHNHYLTLPVLFTMLSNHFPSTYGNPHNWAVLLGLIGFGAALKYVMNARYDANPSVVVLGAAALVGVIALTIQNVPEQKVGAEYVLMPAVPFSRVREIVTARCLSCHAQHPTNPAWPQPPLGIVLEDPHRLHAMADRIMVRAVITKTMPLGNLTGMTEAERQDLGAWIAHGADIEGDTKILAMESAPEPAPGVDAGPPVEVKAPSLPAGPPAEVAKNVYAMRCWLCHGKDGKGDGPTARGGFKPLPRDFTDHAWQLATPDDQIRMAIAQGGAAMGKSPLMMANPDLAANPAVLDAMVKQVRSFDPTPAK